ncbi:MAG TPA: hypothetical protein PKN47_22250 [Nitrospira sp.]|nr:hypothetical protein [Nitrospira sp.]
MKSKTWAKILGVTAVLIAGVAFATSDYVDSSEWNYRITVEIETPEGIKTGSAVRKVVARRQPQLPNPDMNPIVYEVYGEAVAINLNDKGTLFSLINWDSYKDVLNALPFHTNDLSERLKYYRNVKPGTKANLEKDIPGFAFFKNIDDPKTFTPVRSDEWERILGAGIHLRKIEIEITDQPVTWTIENTLPPFAPGKGFIEWQRTLPYGDPRIFGLDNFKRTNKKFNQEEFEKSLLGTVESYKAKGNGL